MDVALLPVRGNSVTEVLFRDGSFSFKSLLRLAGNVELPKPFWISLTLTS